MIGSLVTFNGTTLSETSAKTCLQAFSDSGSITAPTGFKFAKTPASQLHCTGGGFSGGFLLGSGGSGTLTNSSINATTNTSINGTSIIRTFLYY